MLDIPREPSVDSTLTLMRNPYGFISERCRRYESDLFETRLMLRRTICMTGPEAAELFYDESRFTWSGVAPGWLKKTLFGQGGVQGLDTEAHQHRKQMFLSLISAERVELLGGIAADWLKIYARKWAGMHRIVLYSAMNEILARAVCNWAAVPLPEQEVPRRTAELMAMFERAATFGLGHLWSRLARRRAEKWIGDLIEDIRAGRLKPAEHSAAWVVAQHRDLDGKLLDRHTAAVELINVLRPTVAVSVYSTFAALALHRYAACRQSLAAGEPGYADLFAQEVRRYYPFFPAVMAVVRHDFDWKRYHFPQGRRVALDLHGTNHDVRTWEHPEEFRPERFQGWNASPFDFIPQGGGDHQRNHRCPGEWIAIKLIKVASTFLATQISYEVPEQDLQIDCARLPALPHSRFIISNVRGKL